MDYEKEILNRFKKLSEKDLDNLFNYGGYQSIYNCNSDFSDEEAIYILVTSRNAWLCDSYTKRSLDDYCDFLAGGLSCGEITKSELENCTKYDIIEAMDSESLDVIKNASKKHVRLLE